MTARSLNIAHRGGAALWPENTLPAFKEAIKMGADGIEFDLQLSSDGVLVIYHDSSLRPSNTKRDGQFVKKPADTLKNLSLAQLQSLDVGEDLNRRENGLFTSFPGTPVPAWHDLMDTIDSHAPDNFRLYAELKTDLSDKKENTLLSAAFSVALSQRADLHRFHLVSFDWRCIDYVRARFPELQHAYTTLEFSVTDPEQGSANDSIEHQFLRAASQNGAHWFGPHDWRSQNGADHGEKVLNAIAAAKGKAWFAYWRDITPERVKQANSLGIKVSAWTVNEQADMTMLQTMGIEALITDRPDLLKVLNG